MSIPEMQSCLARLYVDDCFRTLFYLNARDALSSYQLTSDEFDAVTGIDRQMLDFFSASLKVKRRKQLRHAYPMLFRLPSAEIDKYYQRYCQLYIPHSSVSLHQDALAFGMFMEESLAGSELLPRYAADLAKFERLYYLCASKPGIRTTVAREDSGTHAITLSMTSRPKLRPGVEVAVVAYDIPQIQDALRNSINGETQTFPKCEQAVLFIPSSVYGPLKILRLNEAAKVTLLLCDGLRTLSQVVSDTEEKLCAEHLENAITHTIERLVVERVLTA